MSINLIFAVLSAVFVSLVALTGILFIVLSQKNLQKILFVLVSFAVGALFGNVFLILIPESFHLNIQPTTIGLLVILGLLIMFMLEKFILWRHDHDLSKIQNEAPLGYISLVTDALHNFFDGILIASAWIHSIEVGLATTLAVIIHEVPQEISDFGILIHAGFSKRRALFFNFLAAITAVLGVILTFWFSTSFENMSNFIIPIAAGGFIYLAGSDLIPELHREKSLRKSLIQFLSIIAGLLIMFFVTKMHPHEHGHLDKNESQLYEHQLKNYQKID